MLFLMLIQQRQSTEGISDILLIRQNHTREKKIGEKNLKNVKILGENGDKKRSLCVSVASTRKVKPVWILL